MEKINERTYRMYFLAPYSISAMQVACQQVHGIVDYATKFQKNADYQQWSTKDHVVTILNGGTTNDGWIRDNYDPARRGTMDVALANLQDMGVNVGFFYEEDLNNALTAVVFLADERVFNRKLTPTEKKWKKRQRFFEDQETNGLPYTLMPPTEAQLQAEEADFEREVGGKQNAFVRRLVYHLNLSNN